MTDAPADWRPTASIDTLRRRAQLVQQVRAFFSARGLLEVETPIVVRHGVTDVQLQSATVGDARGAATGFLHTSPEYAMKRLLAAGSGDIWQLCHVMRAGERGWLHNSEFTLLEWYRIGFDMDALIDEVAALADSVLAAAGGRARRVERLTYVAAFERELGLDPLAAPEEALRAAAAPLDLPPASLRSLARDDLLDLLVGLIVGRRLGRGCWTFLTHYPASQAALARLDDRDRRVAHRFELYAEGVELANGFHELTDAREQRARFERDLAERARRGLPALAVDGAFLAALEAGMPDCSGVALGFDRLVMLAIGAARIEDVLSFPAERA